jgi:hypothetical protein
MRAPNGPDSFVPGQFGASVNAQWIGRIGFDVRLGLGPVKDVVRRVMRQQRAQFLGLFSQNARGR